MTTQTGLSISQLIELCVLLQERFPLHMWTIGDIHIWPLIRYELYNNQHYMFARYAKHRSRLWIIRKRLDRIITSARFKLQSRTIQHMAAQAHQPSTLFYSDGVSYAQLGNQLLDRYCFPISTTLASRGIHATYWIPGYRMVGAHNADTHYIQPGIDAWSVRAKLRARRSRLQVHLPQWTEANRWVLGTYGFALADLEQLHKTAVYVLSFATYYRALLARTRLQHMFIVAYTGVERMAAVYACKQLGITTIDIQHGFTARVHPAYAHLGTIPSQGYALIPDVFWCWTENDAASISNTKSDPHTRHRTLVGGNPYFSLWTHHPEALAQTHMIRNIAAHRSQRHHLLLTLSGLETDVILETYASIAKTTPAWMWWVRLHPCSQYTMKHAKQFFDKASNINLEDASQASLISLLQMVDLHLTEGSSTVADAAACGVVSLVLDSNARALFQDFVDAGLAHVRPPEIPESDWVPNQLANPERGSRATQRSGVLSESAQLMQRAINALYGIDS